MRGFDRAPILAAMLRVGSVGKDSTHGLMRVAALADVHGNAPALAAVLEEVERERPDLVVFCGDLTWGSLPQETLSLVRANGDPRAFRPRECGPRGRAPTSRAGEWMAAAHSADDLVFLDGFEQSGDRRRRRTRRDLLRPRLAPI